jgi:ankyrin repeat protein
MELISIRSAGFLIFLSLNLALANPTDYAFSDGSKGRMEKQLHSDPVPRLDGETVDVSVNYCPDKSERGGFCGNTKTPLAGCNSLMIAAESGDLNRVRTLLDEGADVNAKGPAGHSALSLTAVAGHLNVVEALLAAGAHPNARMYGSHSGEFSTLMCAMDRCNKEWMKIVDAMIAAGAEVNPKDFSRSPLMYAVERHDVVLVKALLARGANVNLKSGIGTTPLMTATVSCVPSVEVVKLLVAAGADADARSNDGETALSLLDTCSKLMSTTSRATDRTTRNEIARLLNSKR